MKKYHVNLCQKPKNKPLLPLLKYTCIILLLLLPAVAIAQPTERVVKRYSNATEEYFVLKTDRSLKHGYYRQTDWEGNTLVEGFFNLGIQTSLWKQYYSNQRLYARGSYSDGYKAGVWEYYNKQGKLIQKYDHTAQKIVYFFIKPSEKNKRYIVFTDEGAVETKLKTPPMFIGAEQAIIMLLEQTLQSAFSQATPSATVTYSILIKKNGEAMNHSIAASSNPALNNKLLDAIKTIPNFWIAGHYNGKPADIQLELTLTLGED